MAADKSTASDEETQQIIFPVVVAEKIASYLDGKDLVNLGCTCKYWNQIAKTNGVWKNLVRIRFGEKVLSDQNSSSMNFKQIYFKLGLSKRSVSRSHYILHLNDKYLVREAESDSFSGEILHLKSVCWLQVNDTFQSVLPGRYMMQYRMKLDGVYCNGRDVQFKAHVQEDCGNGVCSTWSRERLRQTEKKQGSGNWFIAEMGEIQVDKVCDVGVEIHGRVDYWCGGIFWDTVELKPLLKSEKYRSESQNYKANGSKESRLKTCLTS